MGKRRGDVGMWRWVERFLSRRIRKLEEENKVLQDQVDVFFALKEAHLTGKKMDYDFGGEFVPILANMMYEFFSYSGGENYVEIRLNPKDDRCGPLILTLQRVFGKTPAQLRNEAENEVKTLQKKIEELTKNQG